MFHGNADPPEREAYLEQMVRLGAGDRPDVVCLQEVPAWALSHLAGWSGMQAFGDIAQRPRLGPLPIPAELGRVVTSVHHGLLRSAVAGQANAILFSPEAEILGRDRLVLNNRDFRKAQSRWLGLPLVASCCERWGVYDGSSHVWFELWPGADLRRPTRPELGRDRAEGP